MTDRQTGAAGDSSAVGRRGARPGKSALLTPHAIATFAIGVIAAGTFVLIVATLDRGFDWGDEGFVYALIVSDRRGSGEFWGFHFLLNPLYELFGASVLVFRVLRLLGYVALGLILTMLARSVLQSWGIALGRWAWVLVALVGQVGTFATWSYPPRYVGYNELASWFTQLASALLIVLLLRRSDPSTRSPIRGWQIWLGAGALLGLLLIAKISAGAFLLLVAILSAALSVEGRRWFQRLGALIVGFVATLLLLAAVGVPVGSYLRNSFQLGADPASQVGEGYSLRSLLNTYLDSMVVTVGAIAVPILLTAVIVLIVRGRRQGGLASDSESAPAEHVALFLAFVLAVLIVGMVAFPRDLDSWVSLGAFNLFVLAFTVLVFAVQASEVRASFGGVARRDARLALAFVIFALAPLASALGTNNRIFGHTVFSSTIWAVGAGVALVMLYQSSRASGLSGRILPLGLGLLLVATSSIAVMADIFRHPYQTAPYFTQKSTIRSGDLRGIRVTDQEASLYAHLRSAGETLDADGVPALSIASPGALLAFNASGWSAIWSGPGWAASIASSCDDDPPEDLFVLQSAPSVKGTPAHDRLVAGLANCGIDFPDDFEIVDRHRSAEESRDVVIWRLV